MARPIPRPPVGQKSFPIAAGVGLALISTACLGRPSRSEVPLAQVVHAVPALPGGRPPLFWALGGGRLGAGVLAEGGRALAWYARPYESAGPWRAQILRFPRAMPGAQAVVAADGILLFEGRASSSNGRATLWLRATGSPSLFVLPEIPGGARITAAASLGDAVYAAAAPAGLRAPPKLYRVRLPSGGSAAQWQDLGPPPNLAQVRAIAVQRLDERPVLFLVGPPRSPPKSAPRVAVISFGPGERRWRIWSEAPPSGSPCAAAPWGIASLCVLAAPAAADAPPELQMLNTATGAWLGPLAIPAAGRPVMAAGAGTSLTTLVVAPAGRAELVTSTYQPRLRGLRAGDYAVLALFLAGLIAIGCVQSRKSRSAEGYFRGRRSIPWLAAGLSVVATRLTATSFIAIPAKSFATNWQYALVPLTNLVGAFLVTRYFVRFFVRLDVTSAYEYLEKRFSPLVRVVGSLNYLLYELSRIGILILVPAVAFSSVVRADLYETILGIGLVVTAYTVAGGLAGIIWADVFQMAVKIIGLLVAAVYVFSVSLGGGLDPLREALRAGKLQLVNWHLDFTRDTFWVFALFWISDGLRSYVADQTIIQRFVSTRDERTASRSIWTSAIVGTLVTWLFLAIGTGLYLFYVGHPARFDVPMSRPDAVFPWFIAFELPPGMSGLLIVALLASAMSSLDGALNSSSTVIVTDFYRRYGSRPNDRTAVRLGRILTAVVGLFATVVSLMLAHLAARSLFDDMLAVVGLLGGGLGGVFLLGMLTTRVGAASVLVGFAASIVVQYYVSVHTSLNLLTYMFSGMASCMAAGYLASFLLPEGKSLAGLTVHTCDPR